MSSNKDSDASGREIVGEKLSESAVQGNEYEDAEQNYQPKSPKFWALIAGLFMSVFLVALDRTIIATAIPRITDDFNSIDDIGWYGSAYMLTAACSFPVSGRLYQLYSTKWVYVTSVIVFEVGSTICGAAPNSTAFIIGRAIAGIGSSGTFSGGIVLFIPLVPLRKRPMFTAIFGLAFGISSVVGPIIGGALTENSTWRWCFYLNLPIGAFTLAAILLFFHFDAKKDKTPSAMEQFKLLDPLGLLFFVPSIVALILALQWGGSSYPWSAPRIIGLIVTFGVLFVAFVVLQVMTPKTAIAPTKIILNRSVAGGMTFMFLTAGSMMAVIYYIAIWFQATMNDSPAQAGIKTIPTVLSMVVMSIASAKFTQGVGYYVPSMLLTSVLCSIGAGLLFTLTPESGPNKWIGYQVIYGLGLGGGFQAPNLAVQAVLPRADVPLGIGLTFFMQQLGGAVFLAVGQNIFSTRLTSDLSGIEGLDADVVLATGVTNLRNAVSGDELQVVVDAYNKGITQIFLVSAILSALSILASVVMKWVNIKGKPSFEGSSVEKDTNNV